jgi:ubiquitin-protein ligase
MDIVLDAVYDLPPLYHPYMADIIRFLNGVEMDARAATQLNGAVSMSSAQKAAFALAIADDPDGGRPPFRLGAADKVAEGPDGRPRKKRANSELTPAQIDRLERIRLSAKGSGLLDQASRWGKTVHRSHADMMSPWRNQVLRPDESRWIGHLRDEIDSCDTPRSRSGAHAQATAKVKAKAQAIARRSVTVTILPPPAVLGPDTQLFHDADSLQPFELTVPASATANDILRLALRELNVCSDGYDVFLQARTGRGRLRRLPPDAAPLLTRAGISGGGPSLHLDALLATHSAGFGRRRATPDRTAASRPVLKAEAAAWAAARASPPASAAGASAAGASAAGASAVETESRYARLAPEERSGPGVTVNLFRWNGSVSGPEASLYEGGVFYFHVECPRSYPQDCPRVRFLTKILHPAVDSRTGQMRDDAIQRAWGANGDERTLAGLVRRIRALLASPEIYLPRGDAFPEAELLLVRPNAFAEQARRWTRDFAAAD